MALNLNGIDEGISMNLLKFVSVLCSFDVSLC